MELLLVCLVVLLLISINAFYVLAEFASVSVRRTRIRQLTEEGSNLASSLVSIIEDPRKLDRYIATCQIGITLSSLGLGAYGQAVLAPLLAPFFEYLGGLKSIVAHSTSATIVLISLTTFQMILGELVPKSVALQHPTQSALYTILPMNWSLKLFSWFIDVLNGSGVALMRILGFSQIGHRHIHSPEEIELLIAESRDGGLLEPDEQLRLHQALRLGILTTRHLMVPKIQISGVEIDTPTDKLLEEVSKSPFTRIPVYKNSIDNIIGMLNAKDLTTHYAKYGKIDSIEEIMRPITFVSDNVAADRLLTILREHRTQQAIVVDEFGRVTGLITLEDVLEELLGEITDEFNIVESKPERLPDGRIRLPGLMRLDEAESWIGLRWEGKSNTVGGKVTETLGYLPDKGEHLMIDGVHVEVERVANRRVTSIIVTPVQSDEKGVK